MNRGRNRWLLRLGILLVVGLALGLWALRGQFPSRLRIENRSGQPIARVEVTLAGKVTGFSDVPPGMEVTVPLPPGGDHSFDVQGRLADGTLIRARFGD